MPITRTSPADSLADRPRSGVVALLDRASIAVAELLVDGRGVTVRRWALVFNGAGDLAYIDTDPASAVTALARVLGEQGFPRRLACVGLTDSMFGAALSDVPRTSREALSALLVKRVREHAVDPPGDLLADHSVAAQPAAAADAARQGYLVWSDKALMEGFQRAFAAAGLRVERLVPPSVALLDLFGRTRPDDSQRLALFVRYCFPALVIGVCAGTQPLYLRFLPDLMADASEGVVGTVLQEVRRTAAFVAERHPQQRLERVCYSGLSTNDAAGFGSRLRSETGLEAEALRVPVAAAPADVDPERLAALTGLLLHGATLRGRRVRPMDLLPRPARRLTRSILAMVCAAGLALATGLTSLAVAQRTLNTGVAEVAALECEFHRLAVGASARSAAHADLAELQRNTGILDVLSGMQGNPVQPLLEALLLVPAEARLAKAGLENPFATGGVRPRLDLQLTGDFSGDEGAARLRACTEQLRARPWCAALSVVQGGVKAAADKEGLAESVGLGAWLR